MLKYQTTLSGVEILQEGVDVEEGSDLFDDDLNLFANNNLSRPTGPTYIPPSFFFHFNIQKDPCDFCGSIIKMMMFLVMVMLFMSILAFHGPWNCAGPAQSHPHDAKTTTQTRQAQPNKSQLKPTRPN